MDDLESVSITEAEYQAALERGRASRARGPTAVRASYDEERDALIVELLDGFIFGVPVSRIPELRDMPRDRVERVWVAPSGVLLLWDDPEADVSTIELLQIAFSSKTWLRELARAAGRVRSEAKARASRENGAKGGRPRKQKASDA